MIGNIILKLSLPACCSTFASSVFTPRVLVAATLLLAAFLTAPNQAVALTPESPEVKELIDLGFKRLDTDLKDNRLGARCIVALAMYKAGYEKHRHIATAIEACRASLSKSAELDVYSHGLVIIFLCEVAGEKEEELIRAYLGAMYRRQKSHGGWGYNHRASGDTSQTQYMALGLWEAHAHGISVERNSTESMMEWILNTQGPEGEWGYQGKLQEDGKLVEQHEVSNTMAAAALSSLMIAADVFGVLQGGAGDSKIASITKAAKLPSGVRRADDKKEKGGPRKLNPSGIDWSKVFYTMDRGIKWFDKHYKPAAKGTSYPVYYLYSLERFASFREFRDGINDPEPKWYNDGYEFLKKSQKAPGEWSAKCGAEADTAFAMLFLLRSTQKSIRARIGLGAMLSGRGLPTDLAGARFRNGKVIGEVKKVGLGEFLSLVDGQQSESLDQLADDPNSLITGELTEADTERLRRLLRGGKADARLVAARLLSASGELDSVPSLLYAFTDPDPRVVLAARDGLRLISRRPEGFNLPDDFDEQKRYAVLDQWKNWYLDLRPDALVELD